MNAEVIRLDHVPAKYTPGEPGIPRGSDQPYINAVNVSTSAGMRRRLNYMISVHRVLAPFAIKKAVWLRFFCCLLHSPVRLVVSACGARDRNLIFLNQH